MITPNDEPVTAPDAGPPDRWEQTARVIRRQLPLAALTAAAIWGFWLLSLALGTGLVDFRGQLLGTDHVNYYSAARLVREGRAEKVYDYEFIKGYQQALVGREWPFYLPFRNPPFYALLYTPTAGLSREASFFIWTAVGLAAFGLAMYWLWPDRRWRAALWSLSFYPVFATVAFGQNSFQSLAIVAGVYRLSAAGRPFLAGMTAGLLLYKPQLLTGLGLWWLLEFRRFGGRALAGMMATGLVLAGISVAVLPEASLVFVRSLRSNAEFWGPSMSHMHGPRSFWGMLLPGTGPLPEILTAVGLVVGVTAFVLLWRARRDDLPAVFAAAVFLTLWASPHPIIYDWTLTLVPAALLWQRDPSRHAFTLCLFAAVWMGMALSAQLSLAQMTLADFPVKFQLSVPVLTAVAYLAWRDILRRPTPPAPPIEPAPATAG